MLFQDKQQRRSCLLGFAVVMALLPVFALIWLAERLGRLAIQEERKKRKQTLQIDQLPRCGDLPQPTIDPATWRLRITGDVKNPVSFTLDDLMKMRKRKRDGIRMTCAKGWRYYATWHGARFDDIVARVGPLNTARWVRFVGADGYYECASLVNLMVRGAFLAHWFNDKPLPANHGAPVRLIFPGKYGYKAVKWLTEISFVSSRSKGYLDGKLENYDADGTAPLAQPKRRRGIPGGKKQKP